VSPWITFLRYHLPNRTTFRIHRSFCLETSGLFRIPSEHSGKGVLAKHQCQQLAADSSRPRAGLVSDLLRPRLPWTVDAWRRGAHLNRKVNGGL